MPPRRDADGTVSYSSRDFIEDYEFSIDQEFEYKGVVASWAPSQDGARLWDQEDAQIDLSTNDPVGTDDRHQSHVLALSPDDKFLAVAMSTKVRIYDTDSLALTAEMPSFEYNAENMSFRPRSPDLLAKEEGSAYFLVVTTSGARRRDGKLYKILLDIHGRVGTLSMLLANGTLPYFGSRFWAHNGDRLVHLTHDRAVVVLDIPTGEEVCRLEGHTDAIMWASWSLDSTTIATACWDHTFGIWDAMTGSRKHTIQNENDGGRQNWSGGFLGDLTHVLLSGTGPQVRVFDVETAEVVISLQSPAGLRLDSWMRYFAIHPLQDLIVLQTGRSLIAWSPFESSEPEHPSVEVLLSLTPDPDRMVNSYGGIHTLYWADRGNKFIAQGTDHTIFVWDLEKGWKWRFQRPKGRALDGPGGRDVLYLRTKEGEWVCSMAEHKIRFWRL